jgi:ferredoxin
MSGAIYNNDQWEAKIKELQEKVKLAEEKSKEVNTQIETQVIEKTKVIREKGKTQIEYINRLVEGKTVEIVKDMSAEERAAFEKKQKELQDALKNCPVPKIIVEELNKATEQK